MFGEQLHKQGVRLAPIQNDRRLHPGLKGRDAGFQLRLCSFAE